MWGLREKKKGKRKKGMWHSGEDAGRLGKSASTDLEAGEKGGRTLVPAKRTKENKGKLLWGNESCRGLTWAETLCLEEGNREAVDFKKGGTGKNVRGGHPWGFSSKRKSTASFGGKKGTGFVQNRRDKRGKSRKGGRVRCHIKKKRMMKRR